MRRCAHVAIRAQSTNTNTAHQHQHRFGCSVVRCKTVQRGPGARKLTYDLDASLTYTYKSYVNVSVCLF